MGSESMGSGLHYCNFFLNCIPLCQQPSILSCSNLKSFGSGTQRGNIAVHCFCKFRHGASCRVQSNPGCHCPRMGIMMHPPFQLFCADLVVTAYCCYQFVHINCADWCLFDMSQRAFHERFVTQHAAIFRRQTMKLRAVSFINTFHNKLLKLLSDNVLSFPK